MTHGRWLWVTGALFALRVVAQPAARVSAWRVLPPFEAWQSGALPYGWLLATQIAILVWMTRTAWRVSRGSYPPVPARGRLVGGVAAVYGAVMLARLGLGATMFAGHWWLDAPLPTVFHLVIASYLGVYAHFHLQADRRLRSRT